jgi:hypothetical protein
MSHLSKPARKYIHRYNNTYDAYESARLLRDGRPSLRQDQRVHQLRLIEAFYTDEYLTEYVYVQHVSILCLEPLPTNLLLPFYH